MEALAKLITAMAALLGAIVWPVIFLTLVVLFRKELAAAIERLPGLFDRLRKMKVAGVEAELDALAEKSPDLGGVTADQARAAAQLSIQARESGSSAMQAELDKLCLQYDTILRTMPAGALRTQEMNRILVKLRALGPSTSGRIDALKRAGSAGSRLAAVAMMQMEPELADLPWLLDRFSSEAPFVFYHAALALENAANAANGPDRGGVAEFARQALAIVEDHLKPDEATVAVLRALIEGGANA